MDFLGEILGDFLEDFMGTVGEIGGTDLGTFSRNGFPKFKKNTLLRSVVFASEDMAKAADMSTPGGVDFMIDITNGINLFGGK